MHMTLLVRNAQILALMYRNGNISIEKKYFCSCYKTEGHRNVVNHKNVVYAAAVLQLTAVV